MYPLTTARLVLAACAFVITSTAHGAEQTSSHEPRYYSYHPRSPLALGKGFSPARLEEPKPQCVKGTAPDPAPGAINTTYESYLVFDSQQLKEVLKLDARIDASYLSFSASASFNYKYSSMFSANSLTFVVQAESEYRPRHFLPPHELEGFVQAIVKSPGALTVAGAVYQACGTHIALVERRGASVAALLTITGMTQQERTEIAASLEGKGTAAVASGSVSVHWSREIEKASKSGRLDIRVLATGGGGIEKLSGLVSATLGKPDTSTAESTQSVVEALGKALANYLESAGAIHAAPLGYHVTRLSDLFPQFGKPSLLEDQRMRRVSQVVERHREIDALRSSALSILEGLDPRSPLLSNAERVALEATVSQFDAHLDELASLHESCRDAATKLTDCRLPGLPQWNASVPPFPPPPRSTLLIETDHGVWDAKRSVTVVSGGWTDILARSRQLQNEANWARILLDVSGSYIETAALRFVPSVSESGVVVAGTTITALEVNPSGGRYVVATGEGPVGLLAMVIGFKAPQNVVGAFVITVGDKLSRSYDVEIASLRWLNGESVVRLTVN